MAETCIVCLGDLALFAGGPAPAADLEPAVASLELDHAPGLGSHVHVSHAQPELPKLDTPAPAATPCEDEAVAHLLPCGHNLHNACLKPWVERANSCPICRASFNMVELRDHVGGLMISSYAVEDKQQVAEIDPSMLVDDDELGLEDDGSYDACYVCDEFGDSSQLMYCYSCEQLCHVFCAGLDRMPSRGAWYCQGCIESPDLISAATQRGIPRSPAAFFNGRSRLPRRAGAPDEWVGVWQSVWNRLHFDLDFPYEDDEQSDRSEVQKREQEEWERRFALARQMGAGNRFRAAADNVHMRHTPSNRSRASNHLHRDTPKTPKDPESQDELRAWNLFEKARDMLGQDDVESTTSNTNSRRRKRKSADSSPAESEPQDREPERRFKRPRTRLNADVGESSAAAARRDTSQEEKPAPPNIDTKDDGDSGSAPGFLQSLLKEVEVDRFAEREREIAAPIPRRIIVDRACSPQNSSPGLSPVYQTPLRMATPPPLTIGRMRSRSSSIGDEAQHSPTYSPYSPADDDVRFSNGISIQNLALRPQGQGQGHGQGLHSPPRSKDSSPTRSSLSYSTKAEIQRMVTAVLKPMYIKKEVSKNDYTEINREVSRLLYERVGDAGAEALANKDTRVRWQKMAADEVHMAVRALQEQASGLGHQRSTSIAMAMAEDSASSSS